MSASDKTLVQIKNWAKRKNVKKLIEAINPKDLNSTLLIVDALGEIGDNRAIDSLVGVLNFAIEGREQTYKLNLNLPSNMVEMIERNLDTLISKTEQALEKIFQAKISDSKIQKLAEQKNIEKLMTEIDPKNVERNVLIAEEIGGMKEKKAIEPLIGMLQLAYSQYKQIRDLSMPGKVKDVLYKRHSRLCISILNALDELGCNQNADLFAQVIHLGNNQIKDRAAAILARCNDSRTCEALLSYCYSTRGTKSVMSAEEEAGVRALVEMKYEPVMDYLIAGLIRDNSGYDRLFIAKMLDQMGDSQWESLVKGDESDILRIAETQDERFLHPFLEYARLSIYNDNVNSYKLYALGKLGDNRALEPLMRLVKENESWRVKVPAVEAIGYIGSQEAIEALFEIYNDNDDDYKCLAIRGMANAGGERVVQFLLEALESDNCRICAAAAESLGRMQEARAFEPILKKYELISNNGSSQIEGFGCFETVHTSLIKALGDFGDSRAVSSLINNIDTHPIKQTLEYRALQQKIIALKKLGGEKALTAILAFLGSESNEVRGTSLEALKELGEEKIVKIFGYKKDNLNQIFLIEDPRIAHALIHMINHNSKHAYRKKAALRLIALSKANPELNITSDIKKKIVTKHSDNFSKPATAHLAACYSEVECSHYDSGVGLTDTDF